MNLPRSSGVLLHPTSLPGGRLGPQARAFVDWLAAAGQSWWQVLPLGPPDEFDSPYKAASAFAGWRGLLEDPEAPVERGRAGRVRRRAIRRGSGSGRRSPASGAVADQVRFEREWGALKRYANERGVGLIGDLPIYVAENGADHLAHPELFRRRRRRRRPARRLHRRGPALGQPDLRLVGDARDGLPLVDRALPPDVRAPRPHARRPLPRLRRLLGRAGRVGHGEGRDVAAAGRAASCSTPSPPSSARCR